MLRLEKPGTVPGFLLSLLRTESQGGALESIATWVPKATRGSAGVADGGEGRAG